MKEKIFEIGVKAFITDKKGRLLVLKASAEDLAGRWPVHWDLPGGRITKEGIEGTLKRELIEEIGVRNVKILKLRNAAMANTLRIDTKLGKVWLFLLVYDCKIPTNAKIVLSSEHSDYKWASMREAKRLLAYKFSKEFTRSI